MDALRVNSHPDAQLSVLKKLFTYHANKRIYGTRKVSDYLREVDGEMKLICPRTGLPCCIIIPRAVPKKQDPYGRIIFDSTMKNVRGFDADKALNTVINTDDISFTFLCHKTISEAGLAVHLKAKLEGSVPGLVVADLYDHFHGFKVEASEARFCTIVIDEYFIQLGFRAAGLRCTETRVNLMSDIFIRALGVLYPELYVMHVDFRRFNGNFWENTTVVSLLKHFLDDNF